jgi:hypothetical protein
VIFADGSINNVNPNSFPDLFWALRGGGNNFGLVTRFDLATFPQGPMWGGVKLYSFDKAPQLMSGLRATCAYKPRRFAYQHCRLQQAGGNILHARSDGECKTRS